jgi:hypothetical protein
VMADGKMYDAVSILSEICGRKYVMTWG